MLHSPQYCMYPFKTWYRASLYMYLQSLRDRFQFLSKNKAEMVNKIGLKCTLFAKCTTVLNTEMVHLKPGLEVYGYIHNSSEHLFFFQKVSPKCQQPGLDYSNVSAQSSSEESLLLKDDCHVTTLYGYIISTMSLTMSTLSF